MARAASFAEQVADLLDQEGRASAEHSASRSATGASRSIGAIVEAGWLWECAVARTSQHFACTVSRAHSGLVRRSLRAPLMLLSTYTPQHGQRRFGRYSRGAAAFWLVSAG